MRIQPRLCDASFFLKRMVMFKTHGCIAALGFMVLGAHGASAQDYPNRPIRLITAPAGGGADLVSRIIAQGISGPLGQPVVVENRPSGVVPGEIVSKAAPDGYTLLLSATLWMTPLFQKNVSWDPVRDFAPVSLTIRQPNLVVVHPSLPVKSVRDLVALAKARPGKLNYASGPTGSTPQLAGELFKSLAGIDIVAVPYKGGGPALNDLLAGQVQLMIPNAAGAAPYVKAGRLRALAVTSIAPSPLFPNLPTAAATVPGYESATLHAMFAPAKTPASVINRLHQEIVRFLNNAEVQEKFFNSGSEVVASSPEQLTATIKSEMARLEKLIKDAGIRPE
jgi:tripartite-type tricarboxylate transporter receptor subunit TctC